MASFDECSGTPPGSDLLTWLAPFMGEGVEKIDFVDFKDSGGLSGASMRFLEIVGAEGEKRFVFKTIPPNGEARSKSLGLFRESYFYNIIAPQVANTVSLPLVPYAYGSHESGAKTIVMEDLSTSCIQSGYYFGPGSPLNWGPNYKSVNVGTTDLESIALDAFSNAAKLHSHFWLDKSLLQHDWLRGSKWLHGDEQLEAWKASQNVSLGYWTQVKAKIEAGTSGVNWNTDLIACMDSSFAKISWQVYQEEVSRRPWTLVHGDFHPGNIMWKSETEGEGEESKARSVLLDWEMVGIGSGPQDLAQYLISHTEPTTRATCEKRLVQAYYQLLTDASSKVDAAVYPWESCWLDYVEGGCGRWVWLLAVRTSDFKLLSILYTLYTLYILYTLYTLYILYTLCRTRLSVYTKVTRNSTYTGCTVCTLSFLVPLL